MPVTSLNADGAGGGDSGYGPQSPLAPVHELLNAKDYENAIGKLHEFLAKDDEDPDVHNLLGFSHRKLGRFDKALEHYQVALRIDPEHRGANEYLGELYLQTDQLDKAKERLAVLDDACFFGCNEYTKLKNAIEAYEQSGS
ncbi:MAG: tetratricopeptide repeat protein [Pseudomonadota bacterium]